MINNKDAESLKSALSHLIALKNSPGNGEFMNGAISLAESFHSMIFNHANSKDYKLALNTIQSMGRNAKNLKAERETACAPDKI